MLTVEDIYAIICNTNNIVDYFNMFMITYNGNGTYRLDLKQNINVIIIYLRNVLLTKLNFNAIVMYPVFEHLYVIQH